MQELYILKKLFTGSSPKKYKKHSTILHAADVKSSLYFLESGFVRSYMLTEEGLALTINIYSPGAVFPMTQVLAGMESSFYVFQAYSDVLIRIAPVDKVVRYLASDPQMLFSFTQKLASGVEGLVLRMNYLFRKDASWRIISALDFLMRRFGKKKGNGSVIISLPHTHQDIADIAGVTRETVTREFMRLKEKGIISNGGRKTLVRKPGEIKKVLMSAAYPQPEMSL